MLLLVNIAAILSLLPTMAFMAVTILLSPLRWRELFWINLLIRPRPFLSLYWLWWCWGLEIGWSDSFIFLNRRWWSLSSSPSSYTTWGRIFSSSLWSWVRVRIWIWICSCFLIFHFLSVFHHPRWHFSSCLTSRRILKPFFKSSSWFISFNLIFLIRIVYIVSCYILSLLVFLCEHHFLVLFLMWGQSGLNCAA